MAKSPLSKTRSLSDGGGTPGKLSPSPHIVEASRRQSKDDNAIRDGSSANSSITASVPSTPIRAGFTSLRGLSIQLPQEHIPRAASPAQTQPPYVKPAPLSPKLDHAHIYASPNILPRRSRGLDFSRAATSLHHSTLADHNSPDSSPTIGSRAMNIPGRRVGDYGNAEQSSTSLWSVMSNHQERSTVSSSLGSNMHMCSDSSSTSDDDEYMDDEMMDDSYITTPQVNRTSQNPLHPTAGAPWMPGGSPAVNSLLSFQRPQRRPKQPRKKLRGPLGLGFSSVIPQPALSKSPPNNMVPKEIGDHARRESISWAANQLNISGSESDDNRQPLPDGSVDSPSRPSVIKRAVTRRGNLLPKTKGFARIRAALAEESAPVEAEFRREAEVVRQVRESDLDTYPSSTLSSPQLASLGDNKDLDDIPEDAMMMDPSSIGGPPGLGLSSSFKQQALRNSKGKDFWDTFPGGHRTTPPPPLFGPGPRASSAGLSTEDINMDSPSQASSSGGTTNNNPFALPGQITSSSSGNDTPGSQPLVTTSAGGYVTAPSALPPSAAEITRRINSKRRRDDDLDPVSFKRRAVSPGMSVHNSPIMQSPLQRDVAPWGSRPGSVGGDGTSTGKSEGGRNGGGGGPPGGGQGGGGNGHAGKTVGGRVGLQGMMDTNDGITKLSIE
ncbi:hypothetical protein GE09DRAFT_1171704 [Coniochaeta sp. 2T2.1]|nr:hypothetical protein GE09DRAFT_1171704 [Coniochaeta sp. 2T2.1]